MAFGVPCSSFIFLNLATSCRSTTDPFGAEHEKEYVKAANQILALLEGLKVSAGPGEAFPCLKRFQLRIACRSGLAILVCVARCLYYFKYVEAFYEATRMRFFTTFLP